MKWISAFRLRTLPLALASIGMGTFLAAANGAFQTSIFALCALTTILLQVLSNLANDYGDSIHGADSVDRVGPSRAVQSGAITRESMKQAIIICGFLSLLSGVGLIYVAFGLTLNFWVFLGFGLLAILAAVTYTSGYKPYGYVGLGDISVLIFFGFVAVLGSAFLFEKVVYWEYLLPALSVGLFSVGVLNVNNIRDIESDKAAGKRSIPVRIGRKNAVIYHWVLLFGGMMSSIIYILTTQVTFFKLLFLITIPLFVVNALAAKNKVSPSELDPYLKKLAIATLLFVLLFGVGQLI